MGQYEWSLVVGGMTEPIGDQIAEDYDSLIAQHSGLCLLTLVVDGDDAVSAIRAAVSRLTSRHPLTVHRTWPDLVTKSDIAERAGVTPQAVGQWARATRHRGTPFPHPEHLVAGGVWLWGPVNTWLAAAGRDHDDMSYPVHEDHVEADHWLMTRNVPGARIGYFGRGRSREFSSGPIPWERGKPGR